MKGFFYKNMPFSRFDVQEEQTHKLSLLYKISTFYNNWRLVLLLHNFISHYKKLEFSSIYLRSPKNITPIVTCSIELNTFSLKGRT